MSSRPSDLLARYRTLAPSDRRTWWFSALHVAFMAFGAALVVYMVFAAWAWLSRPFIGAFVEYGLTINSLNTSTGNPGDWPLRNADYRQGEARPGFRYPDQLVSINGIALENTRHLNRILGDMQVGDTVALEIDTYEGPLGEPAYRETVTYAITLGRFPGNDVVFYFVFLHLLSAAYLATSAAVMRVRPLAPSSWAFSVFATCMALIASSFAEFYTTATLPWVTVGSVALAGGALITLGIVFPPDIPLVKRWPWLVWTPMLPTLFFLAYGIWGLTITQPVAFHAVTIDAARNFGGVAILVFLVLNLIHWIAGRTPVIRAQGRIVAVSTVLGLAPLVTWIAIDALPTVEIDFSPLLFYPTLLLAIGIAYAIAQYRMQQLDIFVRQSLVFTTLSVLVAVAYALMVYGATLLLNTNIRADNPLILGLLAALLALAINPLHNRATAFVNRVFFRGYHTYQTALARHTDASDAAVDISAVSTVLEDTIRQTLRPDSMHLFLYQQDQHAYLAFAANGRPPSTDVEFSPDSALATTLKTRARSLARGPHDDWPPELQRDTSLMRVLDPQLFLPLVHRDKLAGFIALGRRSTGEPYTHNDLSFLEAVADRSALALEHAQTLRTLEQNVAELTVLNEISQATHYAIPLRELLALIHTHASSVLPADNFYVLLYKPQLKHLEYAFFVEGKTRYTDNEGQYFELGGDLASVVVRTGQPLRTHDYLSTCARHNVMPRRNPPRAWMGAPLTADDRLLGIVSLSSHNADVSYTNEHYNFLIALASQAANAIAKAELYQQTEQRARQLTTLNQLSKALTSTLELDRLLERILSSAVELLDGEAGSLLLTDADTGEHVIEVAVGPVDAASLIGTRVPPNRGIVGAAASSGRTVVVDDVQRDARHFGQVDASSGFVSRAMIAAPLRSADRTIGVLEVINKRSGPTFTADDENLVVAFASQAAVAIENARLFSQTDEALESRLHELSEMQQIVRELNAELDISRVMAITLKYAIQNTRANAGLAAIDIGDGVMTILAHEGYPQGQIESRLGSLRFRKDQGLVSAVLDTQLPMLTRNVHEAETYIPLRPETVAQLTVPIQREFKAIGVIVLESDYGDQFNDEMVEFVNRLSFNAAIAATNAKLVRDVQDANRAKSDLVMAVAHELKNPMTSIKGNASLLKQGYAGDISDAQKELLDVVARNITRMENIVNDLTEVTRIETGQLNLMLTAVDFLAVVEEAAASMEFQFEARNQTFTAELPGKLPLVWGDQPRLIQVLVNLLSNANKYTPGGGTIRLRVAETDNHWDTAGPSEVLLVEVRDTGLGIRDEDKDKVFTKFFRAKDPGAEDAPGTGLGLNIVQTLIELHGGKIWFESTHGEGSTFYFTLPLARRMMPSV